MEKFSATGYNVMHTTTLSRGSPLCRLVWMSKVIRRPNTLDAFGWQITGEFINLCYLIEIVLLILLYHTGIETTPLVY